MGAKINKVIESVEHENPYGKGIYIDEEVKVDFHSCSDIFTMKQGENEISLCLEQLFELKELIDYALS